MRVSVRPFVFLLAAMVAGGCATHSGGASFAERFVHQGKPSVDIGGPPIPTAEALQSHMRQVRRVSAAAKPAATTLGATVESTNPALAMALLVEAILPTAENHLRVADEYRRLGVLDAAYARLNRALAKEPRLAAAHEALARIWRDWGLPEEALGSAYRATYFDARSASARNTLGTVLAALGRTAEARHAYQEALALDSSAAYALNNLCYLEFKAGRFGEALTRCTAAIGLVPEMKAAHNNLALVYAAQGDLESARREFLAAGDNASAAYNVGIVHLAGGDYARAATAFEEAIRERPEFTAAKTRAHSARERVMTGH